jgi:branched-chain amino acid transport system substrate-binding protein
MGKPRILVFAAVAGVVLAACGGGNTSGNNAANKPTKVQIAAEGPFTGDEASIGAGALQGIQLAVKDFNNKGGVHGTKVDLVIWDDNHKAQTATTLQAQGISDPTILGIVGPMNSSVVEASEPGLQGANPPLPFVTESASAIKITDSGFSVAHRVNARDDKQAALDGQFMIDQGAKKVEILDSATDYSRPLADAVQTYLKAKAPSIQVKRDSATNGQTNFTTVVTNMKAFNADWVFFADEGTETAPLVQQMKPANLVIGQNIQFLGTDGEDDPSIVTSSQGAYLGAYASNVTADPQSLSTASGFVSEFKSEYGGDTAISKAGPFYGSAYAATQVLLQAINNAPVNNGKISRNDVLSHLASDTFDTILGPIKYDSKGDVANVTIGIFKASGTIAAPTMTSVKSVTG